MLGDFELALIDQVDALAWVALVVDGLAKDELPLLGKERNSLELEFVEVLEDGEFSVDLDLGEHFFDLLLLHDLIELLFVHDSKVEVVESDDGGCAFVHLVREEWDFAKSLALLDDFDEPEFFIPRMHRVIQGLILEI